MEFQSKDKTPRSAFYSTVRGVAAGVAFGTTLLLLTHVLWEGPKPKGGTSPGPRPESRIRIAFQWDGKEPNPPCYDVDRGAWIPGMAVERATTRKSKYKVVRLMWKGLGAIGISGPRPKHYELNLVPGSVLGGENLLYVYQGTEGRILRFTEKGPAILLNGQPVYVDLGAKGSDIWLDGQSPDAMVSLRSIGLSGEAQRDCDALARFRNSGVVIVGAGQYGESDRANVEAAILATRPKGLFACKEWQPSASLRQQSDRLTHLWLAGADIPDLSGSADLMFFGFEFRGKKRGSLEPLAALRQLRTLVVSECDQVRDFRPIGKLGRLEYLALTEAQELRDLSPLSTLGNLRSLSITDCENLTDISAVSKMSNLRYLTLHPSGQIADLTPLEGLKGLRVIVVSKDDLDRRRVEYDRLRRALPKTEIVGVCMGSSWIMVVVAIGVAVGVICRTIRICRKTTQ